MATWLLVDGHFLSHRAWHTTGGLRHEGQGTGVAYGFLRDLDMLADLFSMDRVILAFDSRTSLRRASYPTYKISRSLGKTDAEKADRAAFDVEVTQLRTVILPEIGYRNVWEVDGYEADDILAAVAKTVQAPHDEAIIVSTDKDLWQCLEPHVSMFNPITKKITTSASFREEWKIDPIQWADVKAFAGCDTDDIKGIEGVGEKTAAAWIRGTLKPGKKYDLMNYGLDYYNLNIGLVRLPYPGLVLPEMQTDDVTTGRKMAVQQKLGFRDRRARGSAPAAERRTGFFE